MLLFHLVEGTLRRAGPGRSGQAQDKLNALHYEYTLVNEQCHGSSIDTKRPKSQALHLLTIPHIGGKSVNYCRHGVAMVSVVSKWCQVYGVMVSGGRGSPPP